MKRDKEAEKTILKKAGLEKTKRSDDWLQVIPVGPEK